MTKSPPPIGQILSIQQAGALLKLTPERVRQLVKEGWIKKAGRNQYATEAVVHGYLDFRDDAERRASKSAAAARVDDLRAQDMELRILERSGALMREAQQEAIATVDIYAGGLRADLMAVGARVNADIVMRRKIEHEVDLAFANAAKRAAAASKMASKR